METQVDSLEMQLSQSNEQNEDLNEEVSAFEKSNKKLAIALIITAFFLIVIAILALLALYYKRLSNRAITRFQDDIDSLRQTNEEYKK